MKTKTLYTLLALFAVLCVVIGAMPALASQAFSGMLSFPFEQIGAALRALSLSGSGGNTAAIIIYVILCLLPALGIFLRARKRGAHGEDSLIYILSALLFAVIYIMVNPALLAGDFGIEALPALKAVFGGVCWSVVVSWVVLSLMRRAADGGERTVPYFRVMLYALAFYFVAVAFGVCVENCLSKAAELRAANTYYEHLYRSYLFLALQLIVSALPYVLDLVLVLRGVELLKAMEKDRYSDETLHLAEKLSQLCMWSLKLTVVASLVFNLLQAAFARSLYTLNVRVIIPLLPMAFVLAALLLTRLIRENKSLKDDNDMFI